MSITYDQAVDEMFALFLAKWQAEATGIVGYIPEVRWQGVEEQDPAELTKFWCRIMQTTVHESQRTFRNGEFGKTFTNYGFITIQLFCPKTESQAMTLGRKLAIIARDAFRGKTTLGGVVFTNARILELPSEERYVKFNIIADYEFVEQT